MLALSGCQNEEPFNKPKEGLPVNSVSFTMTSPDKEQIAITRASEEVESNVERMAILSTKVMRNLSSPTSTTCRRLQARQDQTTSTLSS